MNSQQKFREPNPFGHVYDGKFSSDGYAVCSACNCQENTSEAARSCTETMLGRTLIELRKALHEACRKLNDGSAWADESEEFYRMCKLAKFNRVRGAMSEKVEIKVPFAEEFDDYHEIDHLVNDINERANAEPKLKGIEVAFCGNYLGVFYVGRKPPRKKIKEIVKESLGIDDDEHEIEWIWEH
ncbi:MAG: hypothetical protein ACXAC5_03400 [Promethearchaeota archaeon]|jgi:hypothetical protein